MEEIASKNKRISWSEDGMYPASWNEQGFTGTNCALITIIHLPRELSINQVTVQRLLSEYLKLELHQKLNLEM